MSRIIADICMELLSDTIFSSGSGIPGGADITLRTDHLGHPYVPGSTIKGLLREHLGNYLCWSGCGGQEDLDALMGCSGVRPMESERRLVFGDLRLERRDLLEEECSYLRTFTRLENGAAAPGSLHSALCLTRGYKLTGLVLCAESDAELLENAFRLIRSVGLKRSRGFGDVSVSFRVRERICSCARLPESSWIHYRLRLHAPLSISQGTSAPTDKDRENHSAGLDHIPGSAIRGMIMSQLAADDPEWFRENKQQLLQKTVFRSAFPMYEPAGSGGEALRQIPTPLGFYEDRQKSRFYHVLNKDVVPGDKRARLNHYCRMDGSRLVHSSPAMESSLRITQTDAETRQNLSGKDRKMFTSEAIASNALMEGWIHVPDPALAPRIAAAFRTWLCLGADRFGGSGLCRVELLDSAAPNDSDFGYRETDAVPDTLCMLLLTPTALTCGGEVCSLTDENAAQLLGVSGAEILRSATTIQPYSGFNRKWGCALPTVNMYAPGSVFLIRCTEAPSLQRLRELEKTGIGIRCSEGFGQVLFPRDLLRVESHSKQEQTDASRSRDTRETIERRQAKYRWLMTHWIEGDLSDSQCGSLQGLCRNVLYGRMKRSALDAFFETKCSQSTQENVNYDAARAQYKRILNTPLYETLNCARFEDSEMERLALYCELFDMIRKGRSV